MRNKSIYLGIFLITLVVALATVVMFKPFAPALRGTAVLPSAPAPEIALADNSGRDFSISAQRGKVVLVFFGFTNCVDECPLTMAHIKQALSQLGSSAQNVRVVLVTTDPLRDTPMALSDYLAHFDTTYIGIPGSLDQLAPVWKAYNVQVLEGGETHTSSTYVIDRSGVLRLTFSPDTAPDDIAHDVSILLSE